MKNKAATENAHHATPDAQTDAVAGFRFDLLTSETGEKSLRIRTANKSSALPVELIVPGSQAYRFMEAVIHYVATMEKNEMRRNVRAKKKGDSQTVAS